jgi:hypothetical protein
MLSAIFSFFTFVIGSGIGLASLMLLAQMFKVIVEQNGGGGGGGGGRGGGRVQHNGIINDLSNSLMVPTPNTETFYLKYLHLNGSTIVGETTTITTVDTSVPMLDNVITTLRLVGSASVNGISGVTPGPPHQATIKNR